MSISSPALDALAAAVARGGSTALRVHLAGALLDAGRPQEAAEHCRMILAGQPEHVDALVLAERAARACGRPDEAAEHRAVRAVIAERMEDEGFVPVTSARRRHHRRPG